MPGRRMNLPCAIGQADRRSRLQHPLGMKPGAGLSCWLVGEVDDIPVLHGIGQSGGYQRLELGPGLLKRCVAAAMVTVQVGIDQAMQRSTSQCLLNQRQRLCAVREVTTVNQDSFFRAGQQQMVGGQPASLKKEHVLGEWMLQVEVPTI